MNKADRYVIPEGAERPKKKYLKKYLPEDKPLNRREELFVKELVAKDGQITLRDAAINAGYPPKSAHVRAHELTNPAIKPNVVKAIKQFRAELDQKYGVEYKRHLEIYKLSEMLLWKVAPSVLPYKLSTVEDKRKGTFTLTSLR